MMKLARLLITLHLVVAALILNGCASMQPRLGFKELMRSGQTAVKESGVEPFQKMPVEINASVERGNKEFNFKFPVLVW